MNERSRRSPEAVSKDKRIKKFVNESYEGSLFAHKIGISQQQLEKLTEQGNLFHLEAAGSSLYPKWQIHDGKLLGGIAYLAQLLGDSATSLGCMQWIYAKNRLLNEKAPTHFLKKGQINKVIKTAQAFAEGSYV